MVRALDAREVIFVGHSVSAMVGLLAAAREPDRFAALVMVAPSPRYIDDEGYVGGFSETDIEDLLVSLDRNYLGWSSTMAPVIMGNADRPELGAELTASFCRTDPEIAKRFARATFLSDNRADLARVKLPTLVLQCSDDPIAPDAVGAYVHAQIPGSTLVRLQATGHCPNLSAPAETAGGHRGLRGQGPCRQASRAAHVSHDLATTRSTRPWPTTTRLSCTTTRPAGTCRPCPTEPSSRPTRPSWPGSAMTGTP